MSGIVEDGVIDKLSATAGVTALASTRIYPRQAPQGATKPYIVVTKAPGQQDWHKSGSAPGAATSFVNVRCHAANYKAARELAEQVEFAINGVRGTFGSVFVAHCLLRDLYDASTQPLNDDETGFPCVALDFEVAHTKPTS